MTEKFYSSAGRGHRWLFSTENMASVTEFLHFCFILINLDLNGHTGLVATIVWAAQI